MKLTNLQSAQKRVKFDPLFMNTFSVPEETGSHPVIFIGLSVFTSLLASLKLSFNVLVFVVLSGDFLKHFAVFLERSSSLKTVHSQRDFCL